MFSLIREVDAGREIITQDDMTDMVDLLLSDPDFRKLKTNALQLIDKNAGATDETLSAISPFLEKPTPR